MHPVVELRCITKSFNGVPANDCVNLVVRKQSLHAIVGENGAGKTTLMRVLYGLYKPDSGEILLDGKPIRFASTHDAIAQGIGMVSQHYAIIPELSCIDNLILGAENAGILDRTAATRIADELAAQLGFRFEWFAPASTLSPAAAQKLEILKLLWRKADILILDEPTAMLSPEDGEALFGNLKSLAASGKTVLLVTHRLSEVFSHCDDVTVMRAGTQVAAWKVAETTLPQLAEAIVGTHLGELQTISSATAQPCLEVRNLTVKGDRSNLAVEQCSLQVNKGEIVGIAGVDGSGQRELFEAVLGHRRYDGEISLLGKNIDSLTAAERLDAGIHVVPEDRTHQGVILDWPLQDNALLGLQRKLGSKLIDRAGQRNLATRVLERFSTKATGLASPMASLSGGNQQRFVAGRALHGNPSLLMGFAPTRGLDIRGARQVFDAIREQCASGMGALLVSFDLDELLDNCDRILVIYSGRLQAPSAKDRHEIGRLMVGLN